MIMMATLCGGVARRLFSSSSRAVRLAAVGSRGYGGWSRRRELSTSSVWRTSVDPAEESVFTQDHVEMREVSVVAAPPPSAAPISLLYCLI